MKIPLPERGPIDDTYLYKLVEAVNDIDNTITRSTYNYATVDTTEAGRQNVQTGHTELFATSIKLVLNEYVVKDTSKTWYIDLPPGYKYAPIVTATPVNKGTTTTGNDVMVTVTNVTKYRVDGIAKFTSSGNASVYLNILVVGIPE